MPINAISAHLEAHYQPAAIWPRGVDGWSQEEPEEPPRWFLVPPLEGVLTGRLMNAADGSEGRELVRRRAAPRAHRLQADVSHP